MKSLYPILFFCSVLFAGCEPAVPVNEIVLHNLKGESTQIDPSKKQLTIIYFLSPECPLCINYTLGMRELNQEFSSDSISFYGVFSKDWFSPKEVREFQLKYDLQFEMLFDSDNQLAHAMKASVTPEVFVLNRLGKIMYSGKIDDWVNALGKKKLEVSEHYLRNSLLAFRDGSVINPKRTKPIGCLIE